jgi:hypothetical protein
VQRHRNGNGLCYKNHSYSKLLLSVARSPRPFSAKLSLEKAVCCSLNQNRFNKTHDLDPFQKWLIIKGDAQRASSCCCSGDRDEFSLGDRSDHELLLCRYIEI